MPNKPLRVVIDTNIWISFLMGKHLSKLQQVLVSEQVVILFSEELFDEMVEVLQRPKFKKYFSHEMIIELVALLLRKIVWIQVTDSFNDCRDAKDNFLLALSVSGKADYLVTGDMDLLILDPFHNTRIITYRSFEEVLLNLNRHFHN